MNEANRIYIVQSMRDQIWKREALFTDLNDAKDHVEFLAIAHTGVYFRVVDDEIDPDPACYKLLMLPALAEAKVPATEPADFGMQPGY